jgi:hypothetical protein
LKNKYYKFKFRITGNIRIIRLIISVIIKFEVLNYKLIEIDGYDILTPLL